MQMGRGDSRNFSGGYGNQPPVDYQRNTVGTDDLRRLTKGGSTRASQPLGSFGPGGSLFSSRSNSNRKGPGGSLTRPGEDSGVSSRTGTPPTKESATSANAFRYVVQRPQPDINTNKSTVFLPTKTMITQLPRQWGSLLLRCQRLFLQRSKSPKRRASHDR